MAAILTDAQHRNFYDLDSRPVSRVFEPEYQERTRQQPYRFRVVGPRPFDRTTPEPWKEW